MSENLRAFAWYTEKRNKSTLQFKATVNNSKTKRSSDRGKTLHEQ